MVTSTSLVNPSVLAPFGVVATGSLVVLLLEVLVGKRQSFLGRPVTREFVGTLLSGVSSIFLFIALIVAAQFFATMPGRIVFDPAHPMVAMDRLTAFATILVCIGSIFTCWLASTYLDELRIHHGEFYALLLLASSGMVLLVQSVDLVTLFMGIELMSIPIYALAGFARRDLRSNESALKYFLVGSFTSAILLYGMALLYGATGSTDFVQIRQAFDASNLLAIAGLGLLVVGFAFKVAAVPFHQWAPDVYEGAPTAVTSYMAVAVKVSAFVALLRIAIQAFGPMDARLSDLFWVLSAASIIVGNVMAVIQENVKRMLAYSSIANAGYILIGLAVGTKEAYAAVLFFLLVYLFMNVGAFAVVITLATGGKDRDRYEDYAGLSRTRPTLAALLTLFVVAQAGLPGTGGFIAKFILFSAALKQGFVWLPVIAILGSAVSFYYYLRLPVLMYTRDPEGAAPRMETSTGEGLVLCTCAVAVLLLGLFPAAGPGFLSHFRALEWVRETVALLG
jgi:NADH-quinone oxidoreductase subunit N